MMCDACESDLRALHGAYTYLRAHADLEEVSTTARLLRRGDLIFLAGRVRDELEELRGAVAGTHGHGQGRDDIVLETYQSLYWLMALAVAAGDDYDDLRPHEMLAPTNGADAATELPASWLDPPSATLRNPPRRRQALREGFSFVGAQCRRAGVDVAEAVRRDLRELRAKPYLGPYWKDR